MKRVELGLEAQNEDQDPTGAFILGVGSLPTRKRTELLVSTTQHIAARQQELGGRVVHSGLRQGVRGEMVRDSGHMKEMVSTAPPSSIPRCTRVPGGLCCLSGNGKHPKDEKWDAKGKEQVKKGKSRAGKQLWTVSERLRVCPVKLSMNRPWERGCTTISQDREQKSETMWATHPPQS